MIKLDSTKMETIDEIFQKIDSHLIDLYNKKIDSLPPWRLVEQIAYCFSGPIHPLHKYKANQLYHALTDLLKPIEWKHSIVQHIDEWGHSVSYRVISVKSAGGSEEETKNIKYEKHIFDALYKGVDIREIEPLVIPINKFEKNYLGKTDQPEELMNWFLKFSPSGISTGEIGNIENLFASILDTSLAGSRNTFEDYVESITNKTIPEYTVSKPKGETPSLIQYLDDRGRTIFPQIKAFYAKESAPRRIMAMVYGLQELKLLTQSITSIGGNFLCGALSADLGTPFPKSSINDNITKYEQPDSKRKAAVSRCVEQISNLLNSPLK